MDGEDEQPRLFNVYYDSIGSNCCAAASSSTKWSFTCLSKSVWETPTTGNDRLHTGHVLSVAAGGFREPVDGPSLVTRDIHSSTWRANTSEDAASNGIGVWQMGQAVVSSKPTGRLSRSLRMADAVGWSGPGWRMSGRAGAVCDVGRVVGISMPWRAGGGGDGRVRRSYGNRCVERTAAAEAVGGVVVGRSALTTFDVAATTLGATTTTSSLRRLTTTSTSGFTGSAAAAVAPAVGGVVSVTTTKQNRHAWQSLARPAQHPQ